MSRYALNDAFEWVSSVDMGLPAKVVLLSLANRHNQETGRCDPGMKRICEDTRLSERAVRKAIRELEDIGAIATRHRKQRYARQTSNLTNSYVFCRLGGGAQRAGGVGHSVPPKREDTRARETSRPYDLVMLLEDDDGEP